MVVVEVAPEVAAEVAVDILEVVEATAEEVS
jgi:hypothetical protein